MSRDKRRSGMVVGGVALMALACAGTVLAQEPLSAQARFCDEFDHRVILGGHVDEAPRYLTPDFKEHNLRLTADGLEDFTAKLQAMRSAFRRPPGAARPAATAPPHRTVLTRGDLVVFITELPARSDPAHPGQVLPASSHFDVYRMRDGKIAEHWD